jgi:hypothetical protein
MENQLPEQSFISIHLNTKGKYSWDIKLGFPVTVDEVIGLDAINLIRAMDTSLRQKFPNNTAELKNTGRFGAFGTEEENE